MALIQIELREDESLTSFCSRLAAANARSAYELCQDFDFTFRKVVDGDEDTITALSRISGVDRELLDAAAVKKAGEHSVFVGGDPTPWAFHPRSVLKFCPSCFAEDDKRVDLRPRTRRYVRKTWYSRFVRTCPIHARSLVSAGVASDPTHKHDLCNTLGELRREIIIASAGSTLRRTTAFDHYILGRLKDQKPGNDLLDPLPMYVAGDICELAGMVALYGKNVETSTKSDHEWWLAGAAGFAFFKDGLPGLYRFLDSLHVQADHPRAFYGGNQLYGKFYNILASGRKYPAYDPVRDMIRGYAYRTLPLTDNSFIFGRYDKPKYLSFQSFEQKFGINTFLLRKVLLATGTLSTLPGTDVEAIEAETAELVATSIRDLVRSADGAAILGVSYLVFRTLADGGIVIPVIPKDDKLKISAWYSSNELAEFRNGLLARGNLETAEGLLPIQQLIKIVTCSYADIINLLKNNELKRVGIDQSKFGIMSLLLDRDELKGKVLLPHHGCLTASDLSARWNASIKAVYALFKNRHIETRMERNPETRALQIVAPIEAIEAFENRYMSLAECCEKFRMSVPKASNILKRAGLTRAFPREQIKDAFYLRNLAEAALRLEQVPGIDLAVGG